MGKSEVITTGTQIFNQCRLLVFSQRFVRLGVDLKTNAMLFLHSEIFVIFAVFNKYFVYVQLMDITIYFS